MAEKLAPEHAFVRQACAAHEVARRGQQPGKAQRRSQIDDPADREGMAHFLEHMLFLGTAKYPEANAYGNFMQSNGGYNNAYTSLTDTNYHFEVSNEGFEETLDMFA